MCVLQMQEVAVGCISESGVYMRATKAVVWGVLGPGYLADWYLANQW